MHQEFKSENWMGGGGEVGVKFKATVTVWWLLQYTLIMSGFFS